MPAIHAVPLPPHAGEGGKGRGVIPLRVGCRLIGERRLQLFQAPDARHHAGHGRAGQRIVDALVDGERLARGRKLLAEQVPAAEGLHHGDPDPQPLAGLIQPLALRVHVGQHARVAFALPELFAILIAGQQVVARVDAEHQHVDAPALHRSQGGLRVVAAHAQEADMPGLLLRFRILHDGAVGNLLPLRNGIHIVDHPDIDVIRTQVFQHGLKGGADLLRIPGGAVLAVFPDGAQVRLQHKRLPAALDCASHPAVYVGIGRI